MPAGVAAFVLILRHRALLPAWTHPRRPLLSLIAAWFALSVAMQVASGLDNARMLSAYRDSPSALAPRHYVPLFGYTADRGQFTPWHLRLLALENGKSTPPQLCPAAKMPQSNPSLLHHLPACLYARIQYLVPDTSSLCSPK